VFDYSTPPAGRRSPGRRSPGRRYPPGRRPPRLGAAAGLVAVGLVAALVAGHELTSHPAAPSKPAAATSVESHTQPLRLGACIDPTLSIVQSFAPAIRHDLAAALGKLAPDTGPPVTDARTAPLPAVSLLVRQVDTTSFSSNPGLYTASVSIPDVPGLTTARPNNPSAADYAAALDKWSTAADHVISGRKAAATAAASAQQAVASMPLDQNPADDSAISACVSALLVNVPSGGRHSFLLASDLEENENPQLAGSFGGAPLIIVQTCDSGNASTCQGLLRHFERLMHRLDVGPVTVIRPEDAAVGIAQWIRTGEVTS
jgi:hypothetical protein